MQEDVADIKRAVQKVLSDVEIDGSQPVLVQYDSLGSNLKLLLHHVVGGRESELQHRYREILDSQARQRLPLEVFIRSLVGAAVTKWTLQSVPGIPQPFEGMCESMYRHAKKISSVLATYLRQSALLDHLETTAEALTEDRARMLAGDLDHMMLPFFINPSSEKNREINGVEDVEPQDTSTPAIQIQSTENLTGLKYSTPAWRLRWNDRLQQIFRRAMQMRIQMARARASYTVITPASGLFVRTSSMMLEGNLEEESIEARPRVFVALSPIIKIRVLDSFEDTTQGKEARMLSPATIYAFDP